MNDIHTWFSLTYANYAVLERSLLQSMPDDWQRRFVALMDEFDAHFAGVARPYAYRVDAVDAMGRYTHNPLAAYDRGRRLIAGATVGGLP